MILALPVVLASRHLVDNPQVRPRAARVVRIVLGEID